MHLGTFWSDGSQSCFLNTVGARNHMVVGETFFPFCCPQFLRGTILDKFAGGDTSFPWLCPTLSVNSCLRAAGASAGWLAGSHVGLFLFWGSNPQHLTSIPLCLPCQLLVWSLSPGLPMAELYQKNPWLDSDASSSCFAHSCKERKDRTGTMKKRSRKDKMMGERML